MILNFIYHYANKFFNWFFAPYEEPVKPSMPTKDEIIADITSSEAKMDEFVSDCMRCLKKQSDDEYLTAFYDYD